MGSFVIVGGSLPVANVKDLSPLYVKRSKGETQINTPPLIKSLTVCRGLIRSARKENT